MWNIDHEIARRLGPDGANVAPNSPITLLVVRRGLTYLLYINGQFVQAVHDDSARIAPGGAVALFEDGNGGSARFTNLAVYPVPASLPFWAR